MASPAPSIYDTLRAYIRKSEHTQRIHRFGYELGNPQIPEPIGSVAKIGTASDPAHADHIHGFPDTGWHVLGAVGEPAFENGWASFGGNYAPKFRRFNGWVVLDGLIKSGALGASAFTLPVGYRHLFTELIFSSQARQGGTEVNTADARVQADGRVLIMRAGQDWFSLSNVRFIAEA